MTKKMNQNPCHWVKEKWAAGREKKGKVICRESQIKNNKGQSGGE